MTVSPDNADYRFEVAISFAVPHRDKMRAIAERLSAAIDPGIVDRGKGRVFFDEWFRHEILGSDMDVLLQRIYHEQSLMVVADLSKDYADRPWTQAEARAIRALRMKLDTARDETTRLRLLNVRYNSEELPGVFNTEGWLDGINLSVEEIADVILKRRVLLRQRLERREASADESPVSSPKGWVWHSTLATRAAGQISVLAVVETLLAIALYWWIAIRFETHWHLVTSVFIAPLLLLRSPESMDAGVRWFLKDWIGFGEHYNWSIGKEVCLIVALGMVTGGITYWFASELSHHCLTDLQGWPLFASAVAIGVLSIWIAMIVAIAVTFLGSIETADPTPALVVIVVATFVSLIAAGLVVGMGMVAVAAVAAAMAALAFGNEDEHKNAILRAVQDSVGVVVRGNFFLMFGIGTALRALVFRLLAILFNLPAGVPRLPANWRENNFLTDFCLPAEVIPGIREYIRRFSSDGLFEEMSEQDLPSRIYLRYLSFCLFLPAFLYRLNIKATAWFWWPLAYLLKPTPAASLEGAQREALCWPWSNPAQRLLIALSIGLALLSLVLHWLVATSRIESDLVTRLPLAARVLLGWGWARLAPWHVALWIIATAGAGMLLLAGNACSHHANGNWTQYCQRWPQNIRWMTALSRVRRLATVALLVMALGALLLQDRTWQAYVRVPASWINALEDFYQLHDRSEPKDGMLI